MTNACLTLTKPLGYLLKCRGAKLKYDKMLAAVTQAQLASERPPVRLHQRVIFGRLRLKTGALCLHYFRMHGFAFFLIALLSIVDLSWLQAAEPQFRPALVGNGPKALVNVI